MTGSWPGQGAASRSETDVSASRPRHRYPKSPSWPRGFERFATTIHDTELDLLLSPRHTAPARYFTDSVDDITEALGRIVKDAAALGMPYPYDALSLVEVPARLRGLWRRLADAVDAGATGCAATARTRLPDRPLL